ncbi:hypothetical protein [Sideroxydans lithotrophicus]|uniref:Uncharacterized protein n=1 Tax=Sideroxydans lithotrophicus (strain ES-1) TaxID=580332 RepID=D5CUP3_SIDLE|nr:hypothetical protein [Sideroxydans lithotrophicus]ADE12430.1 hypothetical protein Slit_2202 [Sideroxydans lithotrophicus ES-1]
MPHTHHSSRDKDAKKKPLMTAKEKRMAKHAKKHQQEAQPLITPEMTPHH